MSHTKLLISQEQDVRDSSIYAGYLILKRLKEGERMSIFDLHQTLKTRDRGFTYSNAMYALLFLYMNGLVDFDEPYIYRLKI